jgi:WD40 repeat protein
MMARVWKFDELSRRFEIESVKSFNFALACSQFSSDGHLVASAGHSSFVFVWNPDLKGAREICRLEHPLEGKRLQLEWQNSRTLAVISSSNSKSIYLWNVASPNKPLQVWID